MPNRLVDVYEDMEQDGITILHCKLKSNPSLCLAQGRIVGIDESQFHTEAERCTALIHEEGHFESGAFYSPLCRYEVKDRAETRAWRSAYRRRIPFEELRILIRQDTPLWEIAEHFNVTQGCIWGAYLYYKEDCGLEF
ncbi:MAG: hypothetical protein ACOX6U_03970 [Oscillospiraceae bacterium]|jgi:hypothetical protein